MTLARMVKVLCAARPHHAYVFAKRSSNRLKVLVRDGIGIWLAARRLHRGRFVWPGGNGASQSIAREQLSALVHQTVAGQLDEGRRSVIAGAESPND